MTMNGDHLPATRGDLKQLQRSLESRFATKVDLNRLEDKIDGKFIEIDKNFATKIDLARAVSRLHGEMADMKQELLTASQRQADRILSRLDFYTARMESYRTGTILHGHVLVEVETKLKDHELRWSKIESDRKES